MNNPLISVLIPTYNVQLFVEEAVRSIMAQTYQNLEIIIVDDCSSDDTYKILQTLSKEDSRIRLFRNNVNMKIVETLNFAIKKSNGDYFARMDGDDISIPTRIQEQLKFLENSPEIDLVGTNVTMIDEENQTIHKEHYPISSEHIIESSKYISPIPHFWLAKRSLYEKIGPYRIQSAEDLDFILRCLDGGFKLANHPGFLYFQRMRRGNTATALGLLQRKSIYYVRKLHKERILNNSMFDSFSPAGLAKALSSSNFERYLFQLSSRYHFKYIDLKSKNKFTAVANMTVAVLLSPKHQLLQIYNRTIYKSLLKKYRLDD